MRATFTLLVAGALAAAAGASLAEAWAQAQAPGIRVSQKGLTFTPATIVAPVGAKVEFANDDNVVHNVYSASAAGAFDLKAQYPGDAATIVLARRGVLDVRCALHPRMRMSITIE
jgi:plastocyanin